MEERLTDEVLQLVENDDHKGLQRFLKSHEYFDVNTRLKDDSTLLIQAAGKGKLQCLKQLVSRGANLNLKDEDGRTALIAAVEEDLRSCVGEILAAGARHDLRNREGQTAVTVACLKAGLEIVEDLVEAGANLGTTCDSGFTPLLYAVDARRFHVVEFLLQRGAETRSKANYETALTLACRKEDEPMVELILRYEKKLDHVTKRDGTALTCAAQRGNLDLVKTLVEHGVRVDRATAHGNTGLLLAAEGNHSEICRFLISHGANVNAKNKKGFTALMLVCAQSAGCESIVTSLLEHSVNVNVVHRKTTMTSLMYACESGNESVVKLLLQAGADMNAQSYILYNTTKHSALTLAIRENHISIIRMLIDAGADVNLNSRMNRTPLFYAIEQCRSSAMQLLLKANASVYNGSDTALMVAAGGLRYEQMVILLQAGSDPNVVRWGEETALDLALRGWKSHLEHSKRYTNIAPPSTECVDLLIEKTRDVNRSLHTVMEALPVMRQFVPKLMKHGAVPQMFGNIPDTPFAKALLSRDFELSRFFLYTGFLHPRDLLRSNLAWRPNVRHYTYPNLEASEKCRGVLDEIFSQPWSLFTQSFLAVSFAVGFTSSRAERVEATGLPPLLKKRLLFQDDTVDLELSQWADISLDCLHGCVPRGNETSDCD